MYIPDAFAERNAEQLHAFIHVHSFATLITSDGGVLNASHIPLLLETDNGNGVLVGHLARANQQSHNFDGAHEALVIFQGPHAYISPAWYETEPSVPTWNYAAVHAYGFPRIVDAASATREVLAAMVRTYEAGREPPWSIDSLPDEYFKSMARGIVAFTLPITRFEGKFKLSQNREPRDALGAIDGLRAEASVEERLVADMMEQRLPGTSAG
ncbi:MAG: FMN-binding negative transcriptional regulator [Dehalococcoidia bacterium]|nr:FMN-binding negative transcriptional regulator [Dehalococcoidia bacterium]